jgi:hypothetical protein
MFCMNGASHFFKNNLLRPALCCCGRSSPTKSLTSTSLLP